MGPAAHHQAPGEPPQGFSQLFMSESNQPVGAKTLAASLRGIATYTFWTPQAAGLSAQEIEEIGAEATSCTFYHRLGCRFEL